MTHDPREALERERAELIDLANRLIGLQTLTFGSSNIIAAISLTETERDSIVSALQTVASSKTPPAPILQSGVFKISKSTPVPSDMTLNRKFYPWQELDAGDSFFVRGAKVTALSAKAAWAGRQYGKQYICRSVKGGVRVWCLGQRDPSQQRKRNKATTND
jgi:hypothetical protein